MTNEEVVDIFNNMLRKMVQAQDLIKEGKKKLTYDEENTIDRLVKEGRDISRFYTGNLSSMLNSVSKKATKAYTDSVNRIRKFINRNSADVNPTLVKLTIDPVSKILAYYGSSMIYNYRGLNFQNNERSS